MKADGDDDTKPEDTLLSSSKRPSVTSSVVSSAPSLRQNYNMYARKQSLVSLGGYVGAINLDHHSSKRGRSVKKSFG